MLKILKVAKKLPSRIWKGLVLSMRMKIILDSLFVRPGSGGGKKGEKGESKDWTRMERYNVRVKCLAQEHNTMSPARARTRTARSGDERTNFMRPPRLHTLCCMGREPLLASLWFKHWRLIILFLAGGYKFQVTNDYQHYRTLSYYYLKKKNLLKPLLQHNVGIATPMQVS